MQDKLNILLEQIDFPKDQRNCFLEGSLKRIICNKAEMKYSFEVTLKSLLSPRIAELFFEKCPADRKRPGAGPFDL